MYVYTRIYGCILIYPWVYARVAYLYGYTCEYIMGICWFPFLFVCSIACYSVSNSFVRSELSNRDPDLIRSCARYAPNTLAIRRSMHRMIQRFVPVHAVKTRRRFGSKTTSFHVSVCSCTIFLFIVVSSINMLLALFYMTV